MTFFLRGQAFSDRFRDAATGVPIEGYSLSKRIARSEENEVSIAIPSLEATCHSSEWLVEPHSKEKNKKDTDEYQFANSIFIPERKIVLQVNHKSKTVQIARIKYGFEEYENAQILYQQGYQILHNKKTLTKKEVDKLLNKMKRDHDYMLKKDNKNKTLTVIDP